MSIFPTFIYHYRHSYLCHVDIEEILALSKARREEINDISKRRIYLDKLHIQSPLLENQQDLDILNEPCVRYEQDLPF